jgi:hypothetical protein
MKKPFFLVFFFLVAISLSATDYYVATDGNDGDPGTLAEPWLTPYYASQQATAGDTVYIRGGTYQTSPPYGYHINPVNSGTSGNYITFQNYNSENVYLGGPVGGSVHLVNLVDKSYIKIDGIQNGDRSKFWVIMSASNGNNCSYNIIQNCIFDGSKSQGVPWKGIQVGGYASGDYGSAEYNQILDCNFVNCGCAPADIIYFVRGDTRYNLIQGCTFDGGSHNAIEFQTAGVGEIKWNIIRQNTIRNENHTGVNIYWDSDWNLVEDNVIYDCGDDYANNSCGTAEDRARPRWNHPSITIGSSNVIFRRNRCYNNGSLMLVSGGAYATASDNRIYHNTFHEPYTGVYAESSGLDCDGNIIKNNIFFNTVEEGMDHNVDQGNRINYVFNNQISTQAEAINWDGVSSGYDTVAEMEASIPAQWSGNITTDPTFTNASGKDFTLQTGSPCIDTGDWLTDTNGTGSGSTTLIVDDASYFCDGWNIITGDTIQLDGDATTAVVTAINYGTDTLTLDTALTWSDNVGVGLAYKGTDPDMGAYEYDGASPPTPRHDAVLKSGVKTILKSGVKWIIK